LIRAHLTDRPAHGYEIKKHVERTLGGSFAITSTLLHPALKRFEEMGAGAIPPSASIPWA